jgi:head-tail adaptor
MNAGDLSDRITLEEVTGTVESPVWTSREASPTLWAAVEWQNGRDVRLRIRFRDDLKSDRDIGRGLRALFEGHTLPVDRVEEVVRGREVHLFCHDEIAETPNLATGATGVVGA